MCRASESRNATELPESGWTVMIRTIHYRVIQYDDGLEAKFRTATEKITENFCVFRRMLMRTDIPSDDDIEALLTSIEESHALRRVPSSSDTSKVNAGHGSRMAPGNQVVETQRDLASAEIKRSDWYDSSPDFRTISIDKPVVGSLQASQGVGTMRDQVDAMPPPVPDGGCIGTGDESITGRLTALESTFRDELASLRDYIESRYMQSAATSDLEGGRGSVDGDRSRHITLQEKDERFEEGIHRLDQSSVGISASLESFRAVEKALASHMEELRERDTRMHEGSERPLLVDDTSAQVEHTKAEVERLIDLLDTRKVDLLKLERRLDSGNEVSCCGICSMAGQAYSVLNYQQILHDAREFESFVETQNISCSLE